MKSLLLTLAVLPLVTLPAAAQVRPGNHLCYYVTPSGQMVNLDELCGVKPIETAVAAPASYAVPVLELQPAPADIISLMNGAYAIEYCKAREDGYGDTTATQRAARALTGVQTSYANSPSIDAAGALAAAETRCPEYF